MEPADNHQDDKVLQHNGGGTLSVSGFTVDTFGKLYRSCGNCDTMYERHVIMVSQELNPNSPLQIALTQIPGRYHCHRRLRTGRHQRQLWRHGNLHQHCSKSSREVKFYLSKCMLILYFHRSLALTTSVSPTPAPTTTMPSQRRVVLAQATLASTPPPTLLNLKLEAAVSRGEWL